MPHPTPIERQGLASLAVLIPAWQPEPGLSDLVSTLARAGVGLVLIVNDGSSATTQPLFAAARVAGAEVLTHAVNLGKGRALKTGFNHILITHSEIEGLITADADGQHTATDILRVAQALIASNGRAVLGVRTFGPDVPLRSKFGNLLTRRIFAFVTGTALADTQTGLRAFPRALLAELLPLEGERYEYEMTVLAHICRGEHPRRESHALIEVPIETVYIENNRSSHFDPVRDSMRIYFVLLRFYLSSMIAAAIDFAGFSLTFALTHDVLASVAVGRLSSLVNFALNKKFVFHARTRIGAALWRYYLLVIAIGVLSFVSIFTLNTYAHWNVYFAKIIADVLLSLVSFSVQRTFVFRRTKEL